MEVFASGGKREEGAVFGESAHGAQGGKLNHGDPPEIDPTLEDPRCVFQILKRHFSRYTPEKVAEICGVPEETFLEVAEALCANSGRERTSAFVYAVGWTQHTVGVQYIRTAAIIQLLLGNIGRPGGGIMALRGHASIQGSTDIPTLYNILPGYIPMPHPHAHQTLEDFLEMNSAETGYWGHMDAYTISLLKAWCGDAATADNDYCFDYLPRINGSHSAYQSALDMLDGKVKGYFLLGENPAVGSANSRLHRLGAGQPRLARRPRLPGDRERRLLARGARDRERRARHRRDRDRGLHAARRLARREGRQLHQHPAPAAVAPQGGRAAGRLPLRALVHVPPRAQDPREAAPARPSPATGRSSI